MGGRGCCGHGGRGRARGCRRGRGGCRAGCALHRRRRRPSARHLQFRAGVVTGMRDYWDERAREDAFYFVDNRINYKDPAEAERFWEMGRVDLDRVLDAADVEIAADDVVVEIGCGVGRLTRVIAERAAT